MIRRDPTRIELTLDDIQEYHIKGKMNNQKSALGEEKDNHLLNRLKIKLYKYRYSKTRK